MSAPRAATIIALVLALAGCGGDSGSDDDTAAPAATSASAGSSGSTGSSGGPAPTLTRSELSGRVQTVDPSTLSRQHTQSSVNYPQTPPVGGDHAPQWQTCGAYTQPVRTELAVHSMEHGAVWITYRSGLAPAEVNTLRALASTSQYVLVSPWADESLPAPVVASAWGVQLKADTASDPAVAAFVREYAAGRQSPEPGAPCTGGVGTPR